MITKEKKRKVYKEFFRRCGFDTLPVESIKILNQIDYKDLVKPLVIEDRAEGESYGKLSIKYNLTYRQIKWIVSNR